MRRKDRCLSRQDTCKRTHGSIIAVLAFLGACIGSSPKPVEAAAFQHCKTQEGMGIMSTDAVVFCTKVYGRSKVQAQIDVLKRAVRVFDERCAKHLGCEGMQRQLVHDEMKCISTRRFSARCERRVKLQAVRSPLEKKLSDDDPRLAKLSQLILDDDMEEARVLALQLANTLVSRHADHTSFDALLELAADIESRPNAAKKNRQLQKVPGAKEVNRFRAVGDHLLNRFYQKRGRLPTRKEFEGRIEDSLIAGLYGIDRYEAVSRNEVAASVEILSNQVRFAYEHEIEPGKPKLSHRRGVSRKIQNLKKAPPETKVFVVEYDDYLVFMTTRDQRFDFKSYSVLEKKDAEWLVQELKQLTDSIPATVLRRTESYESENTSYCAIDKDRAHQLDFVTANDLRLTTIPDMKSVSAHYPRFSSALGDEAILEKVSAANPNTVRLFRYPNAGYLAEKNYLVGYEGRLVTSIQEITEPLADRIRTTFPDDVGAHDYRKKGYSDYRLIPCSSRGMYKTHHLIWREMGFLPIGAPYPKRIFGSKQTSLTSKDERVAEKAMLCRVLENRRFPQTMSQTLENGIREAAKLDCDVDTNRFLQKFPRDSIDPTRQRIRQLYDRE